MRERVDRRTDAYMHSRPNDVAAGNSQDAYNTRSGYAIGPATGALSDGCRVPATQPMDCYEEGIHLHYIIQSRQEKIHSPTSKWATVQGGTMVCQSWQIPQPAPPSTTSQAICQESIFKPKHPKSVRLMSRPNA